MYRVYMHIPFLLNLQSLWSWLLQQEGKGMETNGTRPHVIRKLGKEILISHYV
jgi:hypothetical protein